MDITIRKAQEADCISLLALIQELADYEKAPNEVTVTLEHFKESGFGEQPVWWGFVAVVKNNEKDESIVGFALYYIRYSTWKGKCVYLEDFLVTNDYRGKGIGKLLFDAVIKETKALGLSRMVWQVLDWNLPAINFYKKYNATLDPEWLNGILDV